MANVSMLTFYTKLVTINNSILALWSVPAGCLNRHSWFPDEASLWLWWSHHFSTCATMRLWFWLNVSTTIGCFVRKCDADINLTLQTICNNVGDPACYHAKLWLWTWSTSYQVNSEAASQSGEHDCQLFVSRCPPLEKKYLNTGSRVKLPTCSLLHPDKSQIHKKCHHVLTDCLACYWEKKRH